MLSFVRNNESVKYDEQNSPYNRDVRYICIYSMYKVWLMVGGPIGNRWLSVGLSKEHFVLGWLCELLINRVKLLAKQKNIFKN